MPSKRALAKAVQEVKPKLPSYTHKYPPPFFTSWLSQVMTMNTQQHNLLTEDSLKTAWTETMTSTHFPERVNEMNMRVSKSALSAVLEKLEAESARRRAKSSNPRAYPKVPSTMRVNDYKLPSLRQQYNGPIRSVKYDVFVEQLERDNPAKIISRDVVEACFWRSVDDAIKTSGARGAAGSEIIKEAHTVLDGAKRYWASNQHEQM
jgi:hypothetical protein